MKNDALMKNKLNQIENDLKGKSLEDLLYIYYNTEKYTFNFLKEEKNENSKLIENLNKKLSEVDKSKNENENYIVQINQLKNEIEKKEKNIKKLLNEKRILDQKNNKQYIINALNKEIDEKYKKPKQQLLNDILNKKISFEEYTERFKELGKNYYYYDTLVKQINNL
jgi:Rad3-related DNA helicase